MTIKEALEAYLNHSGFTQEEIEKTMVRLKEDDDSGYLNYRVKEVSPRYMQAVTINARFIGNVVNGKAHDNQRSN